MNSMEEYIVSAFYKYAAVQDPHAFRTQLLQQCQLIGLYGRILVAQEGVNGSVCGTPKQITAFRNLLRADARFRDIEFKDAACVSIPFKKMMVKVKKEIVRFEKEVNLENTGKYLTPQEFLALYENKEDFILLDARNEYESRVGKFKGAITPPISTFREFASIIPHIEQYKNKKIVTYCTGGIRCEKASAYLVEQGFENVSQLKGGILAFGKEFPNSIWEGKCFVFDKRLVQSINESSAPITRCELCGVLCDLYKNCAHVHFDKYCTVCIECEKEYGGCCSKECFTEKNQRTLVSKNS